MIPALVQRALERLIEEDLRGATITSFTANVDAAGRITVEEIILRRQDRKEVSIGLVGMRPESDHREPTIVVEVFVPGTGWREMTIAADYAEELADEVRAWHP
jgi:hypothetical protein|nr:hypothetical protein [Methanoculleus marisnigri]